MNAGIYIRVSTQEQALEGYSIEAQKERLINYCKAKEWIIVKQYVDGGYSGSNINRPAIQQLIEDVKEGKLDIVLVYRLDRLSRSQKDTMYLIEDIFLKNGVDFASLNENFDTSTAFGRAMIGILSVFAQLERENIKERTQMGRIAKCKEGYYHGSSAPTGYNLIDGKLIINELEAIQVREVFKLFLEGKAVYTICDIMHKKFTTKKGGNWIYPTSINRVLQNPVYMGKIKYSGEVYDGFQEPIINPETFEKVQLKYKERAKEIEETGTAKKSFQSNFLLTGLLFCGDCGSRMFSRKISYKTHKYLCHSVARSCKRMIRKDDCSNGEKRWEYGELDDLILGEIEKLSSDKTYFDKVSQPVRTPPNIQNERIEHELKEIKKQVNKLLDLYQHDLLDVEVLSSRIKDLEKQKELLQNQLVVEDEVDQDKFIEPDQAWEELQSFKNVCEHGTMEDKRILVHSLINKIVVLNENIEINWSFV